MVNKHSHLNRWKQTERPEIRCRDLKGKKGSIWTFSKHYTSGIFYGYNLRWLKYHEGINLKHAKNQTFNFLYKVTFTDFYAY